MSDLLIELDFLQNDLSVHWSYEKELKTRVIDAIYDMMEEMGVDKIDFTPNDDYDRPCISYDGGNHPEYNSTICAEVYSVKRYLKEYDFVGTHRKAISVDIIDCTDNYEDTRMNLEDVASVFDIVAEMYSFKKEYFKDGEI